ncbi:MAG: dTMP kinase [Pseudomonadota bacterium]
MKHQHHQDRCDHKGRFIVFEGGEGAGKSSLIKNLKKHFDALSIPVCVTYEPGGTSLGKQIRQWLLEKHEDDFSPQPLCQILLLLAARTHHLNSVIIPALKANKVVLCDRFYASTLAYQGAGHGVSTKLIEQLSAFILDQYRPDLTIFLNIDPAIGLKRIKDRPQNNDYDRLGLAFHQRINKAFRQIAKDHYPQSDWFGQIVELDATNSQQVLMTQAFKMIESLNDKSIL